MQRRPNQHNPSNIISKFITKNMNDILQTAIIIKSNTFSTNPFIFTLPANSTSQQHLQLFTSAHILKKLFIIDISQSRELADLFKECLLDVIQNPLIELKCHQTIQEIMCFLEYWQVSLGKMTSWPHTRTCFYYLEEKLKKYRYFESLDYVRLKRAQLQPNKKQFLNQILAQPIHTEALQDYIKILKQQFQDASQNSFNFNSNPQLFKSQQLIASQKVIQEKAEQQSHKPKVNSNILYSDSVQDWKQVQAHIQQIKNLEKYRSSQKTFQLNDKIRQLFETYLLEKLPIYINWMKSKQYTKEKILKQLVFRKSIIITLSVNELTQILNLTISKIIHSQSV